MGKALVIKGADFATNAVERVTPINLEKLVDFNGACEGSVVSYDVDLISTSAPDWVCFVQFSWQGGRTGQIRLFFFISDDNVVQVGYNSANQFYKAAELTDYSSSVIHTFDNSIRKVGLKKQNGRVYATFDGVSWLQTELVPTANVGRVEIFGTAAVGVQAPTLTELRLTVWNDPTYDISPLFNS